MANKSNQGSGELIDNLGFQPGPPAVVVRPQDYIGAGYQPQGSARPEGQNPPSGGSNVVPPPQAGGAKKE
jgi:hypothetical protein